jgi:hypothetical protein
VSIWDCPATEFLQALLDSGLRQKNVTTTSVKCVCGNQAMKNSTRCRICRERSIQEVRLRRYQAAADAGYTKAGISKSCPHCQGPMEYRSVQCRTCWSLRAGIRRSFCTECGDEVSYRSRRCRGCSDKNLRKHPTRHCAICGNAVRDYRNKRCGDCISDRRKVKA